MCPLVWPQDHNDGSFFIKKDPDIIDFESLKKYAQVAKPEHAT